MSDNLVICGFEAANQKILKITGPGGTPSTDYTGFLGSLERARARTTRPYALLIRSTVSLRTTQTEARPARPRLSLAKSLAAIILGTLVLRAAAQMMGQMLQYYFDAINTNYYPLSFTVSGLITASFFVTELGGSLWLGALSDRYGRRLFIILGPLFGAVAVQITSVTVAIWLLILTRLLEGLSTASSVPATLGYISEVTSGRPNLRARIAGLFELAFAGGFVLGALGAGKLWARFGSATNVLGVHVNSPAFSINALVYLASLAIFIWGLRDLRRRRATPPASNGTSQLAKYVSIIRSPGVWRFAPAWLAVNSIFGIWINHSVRLLTGKIRFEGQLLTGAYSANQFGVGVAVFGVLFGGGLLGWSMVLGRYRKTNVMLGASTALFMTLGSVYALNHLQSFSSHFYYPLFVSLVVGIILMSAFTPAALVYLADVTESETTSRGSIMGLYSVFLGVGQLIGTAAGGRFATWKGIDGILLLSVILGIITAVTLIVLKRQESTPLANAAALS